MKFGDSEVPSILFEVARRCDGGIWIERFLVEVASRTAHEARASVESSLEHHERIVGWCPRTISRLA